MNDEAFHTLTKMIAESLPPKDVDAEIHRLKNLSEDPLAYINPNIPARIESTVWGWSVWYASNWGAKMGLTHYLHKLDDAIKVCGAFGLEYKVYDIEDPDPL